MCAYSAKYRKLAKATYIWQLPSWPAWEYDVQALAAPLALARQQLGRTIGKAQAIGLVHVGLPDLAQTIWIEDALATAAIEGQKLDAEQVRSSVMRQLGLATTVHSSREVDGLVEVLFDATTNAQAPLDIERLCRWQSALFPGGTSGIQKIEVGSLRSFSEPMQIVSGKVGKEVVHYQAPPSREVAREMATMLAWFNTDQEIDSLIRAAITHLWFETIHPFEDGNGRLGRALIDMVLAQDPQCQVSGLARLTCMSRALLDNRHDYYSALQTAQTGPMNITPWITWFLGQFALACQHTEQHIALALQKAQFWARHAQQSFNPRQRKTLQKLLDAGDAGFLGGLTAEKHSKITGASKATATRDLTDLLQKGALIVQGVGKATKYAINVEGWNQLADASRNLA